MDANVEILLENDGSARIGDICFRPVSQNDRNMALDDDSPAVIHSADESKFARYDVFYTYGNEFCGHLNMFYDRGGYMCFAERRKTDSGNYEVRVSDLPSRKLFGVTNFPKKRSDLTLAMMQAAKDIHDRNRTVGGWRAIKHDDLEQRISKH